MTTYTVVSDRLSRDPGETFTDDELGEARAEALVAAGHLQVQEETGQPATSNQEEL